MMTAQNAAATMFSVSASAAKATAAASHMNGATRPWAMMPSRCHQTITVERFALDDALWKHQLRNPRPRTKPEKVIPTSTTPSLLRTGLFQRASHSAAKIGITNRIAHSLAGDRIKQLSLQAAVQRAGAAAGAIILACWD